MLLEIQVWGSREWYEKALPLLEKSGFTHLSELRWADPETDGELGGWYFDYADETPLSLDDFQTIMGDLHDVLKDAEAPVQSISVVRKKAPTK